jgi:hypothetical protein
LLEVIIRAALMGSGGALRWAVSFYFQGYQAFRQERYICSSPAAIIMILLSTGDYIGKLIIARMPGSGVMSLTGAHLLFVGDLLPADSGDYNQRQSNFIWASCMGSDTLRRVYLVEVICRALDYIIDGLPIWARRCCN